MRSTAGTITLSTRPGSRVCGSAGNSSRARKCSATGTALHATRLRARSMPAATSSSISTGRGASSWPRRCGTIWSASSSCRRPWKRSSSG
ncbi:hypothetical protein GBAR_LOCUS30204 [Geodia barretti]|nr:hypothetical protein GBAR_LOCUS30204 [Geodia barretti]